MASMGDILKARFAGIYAEISTVAKPTTMATTTAPGIHEGPEPHRYPPVKRHKQIFGQFQRYPIPKTPANMPKGIPIRLKKQASNNTLFSICRRVAPIDAKIPNCWSVH